MAYYRTCPHCGAHLDPGESCDCRASMENEALRIITSMTEEQLAAALGKFEEKAPASASNAGEGGVEQNSHAVSASTITENGGFVK